MLVVCAWVETDYGEDKSATDGWHTANHLPLAIHHIDYVKKNCVPENLITLCYSCNSRANYNKGFWKELYQNIIVEKEAECCAA